MYMYIYIYIERERYTYTYTYVYMYTVRNGSIARFEPSGVFVAGPVVTPYNRIIIISSSSSCSCSCSNCWVRVLYTQSP